jgi:hypothetical protein
MIKSLPGARINNSMNLKFIYFLFHLLKAVYSFRIYNSMSNNHLKFIKAINSKGIHEGKEIETRPNRNKLSSWITPILLNMKLLF